MSSAKYQSLFDAEEIGHLKRPTRRKWPVWALVGMLFCSVLFNVATVGQYHSNKQHSEKTPYAGLTYNKAVPWTRTNAFHNGNRTVEDHAWKTSPGFDGKVGVIALPSATATTLGLPPAQHWPWDKSKGIYIVEEFHIIHCLKDLRKYLWEANDEETPSRPSEHLFHCVDSLRQFVMCHADDTPRYSGRVTPEVAKENPHGGYGQERMCRDWDELMKYMMEYHACYHKVPSDTPGFKEIDNYKRCPDGRVLWD